MQNAAPVLKIVAAEPVDRQSGLPPVAFDLALSPGDLALIEVRNPTWATELGDLCCGLIPLRSGSVSFLGHDWSRLPEIVAAALRGRIGRVHGSGGWIGFIGTDRNILLPELHHTRRPVGSLSDAAAGLARDFGLPGLPLVRPEALSAADLARAALVRAFLGAPRLLLLEDPVRMEFTDLVPPLLNALATVRDRGAAAVWLTGSSLVWNDRSFPATFRLRLTERGLTRPRLPA